MELKEKTLTRAHTKIPSNPPISKILPSNYPHSVKSLGKKSKFFVNTVIPISLTTLLINEYEKKIPLAAAH